MLFKKLLSKQDAICLLELIHKSLSCTIEDDLRELMRRLSSLIPYGFAICGLAKIDNNGMLKSYEVVNISYPNEWLDLYITRKYHQIDPIIKENFTNFRLQYWTDTYKTNAPPKGFLSLAEDFGLKEGYTHGIRNQKGTEGSLFSISGKSIEHHNRTEIILNLIIPHLHQAITRISGQHNEKNIIPLVSREREVLNWISQGKGTWDISKILGISERTVKFHVKNIKQKLDVVSRPQAVAVAIGHGLVEIE